MESHRVKIAAGIPATYISKGILSIYNLLKVRKSCRSHDLMYDIASITLS